MIIFSTALLLLDHRYHRLDQVRQYLYSLTYPIQWAVDLPIRCSRNLGGYFHTHKQLVKENESLKETFFLQEARLQKLLALESENERLRALLQSTPRQKDIFKVAEIIQVDCDPFNQRFILDKGSDQGVYKGQPLIDAYGVMGEIVEVQANTAHAMLISDASHALPIENLRTGMRSIVVGTGTVSGLEMQHVPLTADVQVGDTLVTSGLGGRYPPGYIVGKVKALDYNTGESFARVIVTPMAHLERGRQVLLIQAAPNPKVSEQKSVEHKNVQQNAQQKDIAKKAEEIAHASP